MTKQEIKEVLRQGEVKFTYTKVDGSTRDAVGTLNMDIIREHDAMPKGDPMVDQEDLIRYYDTNVCGWRSFRDINFVGFNN